MYLLYTVLLKNNRAESFEKKDTAESRILCHLFHVCNIYEEKLLRVSNYPLSKFALKTAAAAISRMPHGCSRYTG